MKKGRRTVKQNHTMKIESIIHALIDQGTLITSYILKSKNSKKLEKEYRDRDKKISFIYLKKWTRNTKVKITIKMTC